MPSILPDPAGRGQSGTAGEKNPATSETGSGRDPSQWASRCHLATLVLVLSQLPCLVPKGILNFGLSPQAPYPEPYNRCPGLLYVNGNETRPSDSLVKTLPLSYSHEKVIFPLGFYFYLYTCNFLEPLFSDTFMPMFASSEMTLSNQFLDHLKC